LLAQGAVPKLNKSKLEPVDIAGVCEYKDIV